MRRIYHGSTKMIRVPQFGAGRSDNDYGPGFYCTENIELAKEWAAANENGGFVNCYDVEDEDMLCLTLLEKDLQPGTDEHIRLILNWMALLAANRNLRISSPVERQGRQYLLSNFLPDLSKYDYVIGYRADDSYFTYARSFLSNTLTVAQLFAAMHLGGLGLQYVIHSRRMFERLRFTEALTVDGSEYYPKRMERDRKAREQFRNMMEEDSPAGYYLSDLMRAKWGQTGKE